MVNRPTCRICIAGISIVAAVLAGAAGAAGSSFTHPALDHGSITNPAVTPKELAGLQRRLETDAKEILGLGEAQLLKLIPAQTPQIHHACPACARRSPIDISEQPRPFPGVFDPRQPDRITCKNCNTVFPNAGFPMDRTETVRNLKGEDIQVAYYFDPKGRLTGAEAKQRLERRYYLSGVIDTARKLWLVPRLYSLAKLYHLTRDERYARPVVTALAAFAERYPHYLLTTDYAHRYATTKKQNPPYGWVDTRWGRRSGDDVPADLLQIFDLVASSPSMTEAVKTQICQNLFLDPIRRFQSWGRRAYFGNITPIATMVDRARVLESPELMHECYQLIRDVPHFSTECDGMFLDSAGYASLFRYTLFLGARRLNGYSDPAGYVGPDSLRLANLDPLQEMEEYYRAVTTVARQLRLPSGGWVSYHDAGAGFGPTWWSGYGEACEPLVRSENVLLPGLRRAILGAGTGDKQIQVHLDFSENGVNHAHQDVLTMQIYAYGHYLIDDFPYHKSKLRRYDELTMGHQTVVIDQRNQHPSYTDGDVEFYTPAMDGLGAIRVDDTRAYAGLATRYARTLVLNSSDADAPYVIDVFEVAGGTLHDYHLRSSSQHRESLALSLQTTPVPGLRPLLAPGETWTEPSVQRDSVGSGYGLLFEVRRAAVPPAFDFTFACEKPWAGPIPDPAMKSHFKSIGAYKATPDSWPDNPAVGTRHHVLLGKGYELLTAGSPSLSEAGFSGLEAPAETWPRLPHVILRHRVRAGDRSLFVVVHEPYHHAPKIQEITRLDTGSDQVLAMRIKLPNREDVFAYALDHPRDMAVAGLELSGRMGLVSRVAGQAPRAYLVEGTKLAGDGVKLSQPTAAYSGTIAAMERRWDGKGVNRFRVTGAALPPGDALGGTWIIVQHGPWSPKPYHKDEPQPEPVEGISQYTGAAQAFEIEYVETNGDQTWVYLRGDHGLTTEGKTVREFYFPGRTFTGPSRFRIPTAGTTHPLAPPKPPPVAVTPLAETPPALVPGLLAEDFTGEGIDFAKLKPLNRQVVTRVEVKRVKLIRGDSAIRYTGFLRVPADGVYTFHVGATECRLTLGGVPLIEQFHGVSLMPEVREARLATGLYPVSLEFFWRGPRHDLDPWISADWEGPGLARQALAAAALTPAGNSEKAQLPSR